MHLPFFFILPLLMFPYYILLFPLFLFLQFTFVLKSFLSYCSSSFLLTIKRRFKAYPTLRESNIGSLHLLISVYTTSTFPQIIFPVSFQIVWY